MDAFVTVKKSSAQLSSQAKSGIISQQAYSQHASGKMATTRYTPYSTASRSNRLKDGMGNKADVLPDQGDEGGTRGPLQPLVGTRIGTTQKPAGDDSVRPRGAPTTISSNLRNTSIASSPSSSGPVRRKDILNMRHRSNPIIHSGAPQKSRESSLAYMTRRG